MIPNTAGNLVTGFFLPKKTRHGPGRNCTGVGEGSYAVKLRSSRLLLKRHSSQWIGQLLTLRNCKDDQGSDRHGVNPDAACGRLWRWHCEGGLHLRLRGRAEPPAVLRQSRCRAGLPATGLPGYSAVHTASRYPGSAADRNRILFHAIRLQQVRAPLRVAAAVPMTRAYIPIGILTAADRFG